MHCVRSSEVQPAPPPAAFAGIMIGDTTIASLVSPAVSPDVTVSLVHFIDGARNKRHIHSASQVLYILDGHGIVADDSEELHVTAGDTVHVEAGVIHWHGAEPGKDMTHLSITPPCTTEAVE